MFSCLLFEGAQLHEPSECAVNVDITGWIGKGAAEVKFHSNAERSLANALLYIPTLLCHGDTGSKTRLSLYSCTLKWVSSDVLLKQDELLLTKSQWRPEPGMQRCKQYHHKVKAKVESKVFSLAGALSPNDLIFSVGDISTGVELHVSMSFIFHIHPRVQNTTVSFAAAAMLTQCDQIYLTANITGLGEIDSITTLDGAHSGGISTHITSTLTTCSITSTTRLSTPLGILITLSNTMPLDTTMLKSNCFSVLLDNPLTVRNDHTSDEIHGVQMLSTMPCTKSTALSWNELSPCEAIFMVDCSGSMCGKKIHSASQALLLAVKSLPESSMFNIIAFGSKYRFLFQTSTEASAKNVEKAVQFSNQLQACLGGTELMTPLRWILKKPLIDGLQREVFLITDGGVPNVTDVIGIVQRYKHQTRCHSFALGPDISSELMAGIAMETGGSYVVINEDMRLQTKVMEIVKQVLQPKVTQVSVNWPPPGGYTATKPFPSVQSDWSISTPYTSFTTLTKHQHTLRNGSTTISITPPTITGFLSKERVQSTAMLHHESTRLPSVLSSQSEAILRNAAWAKMQCLHDELSSKRTRNNSQDISEPPPLKKRKVSDTPSDKEDLVNDIVSISLASNVSFFPYTHFVSSQLDPSLKEGEGNIPCPVLPWNGPMTIHTRTHSSSRHQTRKRKRHHPHGHHHQSLTDQSSSLSSLAKRSATFICSTLKTVVNIASFGMVTMETNDTIPDGERIEDQVYHQNKQDRIHWNQYGRLMLPKMYYKSYSANQDQSVGSSAGPTGSETVQNEFNITRTHSSSSDSDHNNDAVSPETQFVEIEASPMEDDNTDDILLHDDDLGPSQPDYMALVQLQLPSGGWPLVPSLARATGSNMGYIRSLPCNQGSLTINKADDGSSGDVWATLMAVGCLRCHFKQFVVEWEVLVLKAMEWVNRNEDLIPVSMGVAQSMVESHFAKEHSK